MVSDASQRAWRHANFMKRGRRMGWGMPRRTVTVLAVMPILAALAVGCTPAPKELLAVERTQGGGARVLIAPCADFDVLQFSAFSEGNSGGYPRWAVINDAMRGPLTEIDLFSAPQGWSVTEETLRDVRAAGKYTMTLDGAVHGRGLDGRISFTSSQFESLPPGEVLVADNGSAKSTQKSNFMKEDSGRCKP